MEPHEIEPTMLDAVSNIDKYGQLHAKYKSLSWELQRGEKNIIALLMKRSGEKSAVALREKPTHRQSLWNT